MQIIAQSAASVQLAEFRDHCRIPWTDDDPALQRSLDGAIQLWESATNYYVRQTDVRFDGYPGLCIPGRIDATLQQVYKMLDGAVVEDVTTDWYLRQGYGVAYVDIKSTGTWSAGHDYRVDVRYAGGISNAVKLAIFDIGNHLFRDRQGVVTGTIVSELPLSLRTIIANFQRGGL